mgnify:CR=1 FL=1
MNKDFLILKNAVDMQLSSNDVQIIQEMALMNTNDRFARHFFVVICVYENTLFWLRVYIDMTMP